MKSSIRKLGNSHGVIIPKLLLAEIGAKADDPVDIKVKKGRIVIERIKRARSKERDPRAAWAEECKAIREAGEDGLVCPEFDNEDDETLVW